jgi:NADPH2:quinone reductase
MPHAAKVQAIDDVAAAVAEGAAQVGNQVGLPLHHFPLEDAAAAHQAVEDGVVGKVLIDVAQL